MRIGNLAKSTGTSAELIRHYEKIGLLPSPQRSDSDQRIYDGEHLEQLRVIRQLRSLDFSLKEIARLFACQQDPGGHTRREIKTMVNGHIDKLDELLNNITATRDYLLDIRERCDGSDASAADCPILEDLVHIRESG